MSNKTSLYCLLLSLLFCNACPCLAKKQVIIFLGPPTSGKTTFSQWCVTTHGWQRLSTEQQCEQHIAQQTSFGKEITTYVQSGHLVPDYLIFPLVKHELTQCFEKADCVLLEGFPRTEIQAKTLHEILKKIPGNPKLVVIQLVADNATIMERVHNRYICKQCDTSYVLTPNSPLVPKQQMMCDCCHAPLQRKRDDANRPIQKRIETYRQYEKILLNFYKKQGLPIAKFTIELDVSNPLERQFVNITNDIRVAEKKL